MLHDQSSQLITVLGAQMAVDHDNMVPQAASGRRSRLRVKLSRLLVEQSALLKHVEELEKIGRALEEQNDLMRRELLSLQRRIKEKSSASTSDEEGLARHACSDGSFSTCMLKESATLC